MIQVKTAGNTLEIVTKKDTILVIETTADKEAGFIIATLCTDIN